MEGGFEQPRGVAGSFERHHHKHKHKKEKHKHRVKDKRREAVERNKEVGSDVESGEILGDGAESTRNEPGAQRASTQPQQPSDDRRTDPPVVHRAAGVSPAAEDDGSPTRRKRIDPPTTGSSPADAAGTRINQPKAGSRKREREELEECIPPEAAANGRAESRGRKEARRQAEGDGGRDGRGGHNRPSRDGLDRQHEKEHNRNHDRELERRADDEAREHERQRERQRGRFGDHRFRERDLEDRGRDRERDRDREQPDKGGQQDRGRARRSPEAKSPEALALPLEEDEDEEARIELEREERRRRQQAILQRHAQQQVTTETVIAPTAAALVASAPAVAAQPSRGLPLSPSATTAEPAGPLRHVASTSVLARSAPGTPKLAPAAGADGGDGDRTPEGERISSSEASDFNGDGPVMDIFGPDQAAADDADSGAAAAAMAAAAEDAERERLRQAAAMLQRHLDQEPAASAGLARVVGRSGHHQLRADEEKDTAAAITAGAAHLAGRRASGAGVTGASADAGQDGGDEDDMFAEKEDDDMFAEVDDPDGPGQQMAARAAPAGGAAQLHDSYDDPEGYYNFQIGEVLDGRYELTEFKGKGVFSNVMRARDLGVGRAGAAAATAAGGGGPEVAIKVIRANETMYKAAQTEQAILRKLCGSDPDNRKHCIRLLRAFEFRKHMCLVFEPMDMNLRDLTKKYGRNKGLNVTAVGMYAAQLLVALRHLRKNGVLHADIKPDNILVNARRTKVKLCDFGSAMLAGDNEVTPYLVSRFYRAPEVILGMKYDFAMDMWSVGCVVYELFTGNILFPGRTNNEMVKLMMDVKGPFTKKMLRRCAFADKHFDLDEPNAPFIYMEEDTLTKKPVRRMINVQAAKQNFSQLLGPAMRSAKPEDKPQIQLLVDLLEKMMVLEPDKRIDTDAAMRHPFVRSFLPKKHEHGHHQRREGSLPM
uniref:non-specific serine/threonine protein kinase n=1 Tax=Yamagishiella unicocca TaxID=51707 RepID=A0A2Z5X8B7_9CHLO|nr:serine/threonine-protein kinase PRP4 [Yamagishiella unicocca]